MAPVDIAGATPIRNALSRLGSTFEQKSDNKVQFVKGTFRLWSWQGSEAMKASSSIASTPILGPETRIIRATYSVFPITVETQSETCRHLKLEGIIPVTWLCGAS